LYIFMFNVTENNHQTKNIFCLTKKAYVLSKNCLHFSIS
jgi:hypothetical protein